MTQQSEQPKAEDAISEEALPQEFSPDDGVGVVEEEALEPLREVLSGFRSEREGELETEVASLKEKLLRALAEADNIRKRSEREREETSKYAVSSFARELVEVLENLVRTCDNISADEKTTNPQLANLAQGVEMTLQTLTKALEKQGVSRVNPEVGEAFNHNHHQAIAQVESADLAPGSVLQVVQAGYVIHERLLRPAMVVVSKAVAERVDTSA